MSQLRIFSYLPNPRIWKATIAARLCGVEIEVRGAPPTELQSWLWDFDARPLSAADESEPAGEQIGRTGFKGVKLRKTQRLPRSASVRHRAGRVQPRRHHRHLRVEQHHARGRPARRGTLPALRQRPLRGVARRQLPRREPRLRSRCADRTCCRCSTDPCPPRFNREPGTVSRTYLAGISRALLPERHFLVGEGLTLADICFVAELALFSNERARRNALERGGLSPVLDGVRSDAAYAQAFAHFDRLRRHPAFAPDVEPYLEKIDRAA